MIKKILLGLAVAMAASGPASAQVLAEQGHILAQQWCSGCHQVEEGGILRDAAPSFLDLANNRSDDLNWVRTRLQNPLYPMSGINLSNAQIETIVAYFESLQDDD
jgi:mono/diheme cytochrome c family protein